ncbi:LysM domain-containing protein [Synechococcus elongatus IITB4]|uniref:LysM peptidoglycan-binding domain-containing protein n=1 Tax=Synechococcus elongatus TaxID=32046 RepID=UPI0030CC4456
MGQYVKRNGRTLYKADNGLLYENYEAAVRARGGGGGGANRGGGGRNGQSRGPANPLAALGSGWNSLTTGVARLMGGGGANRPAPAPNRPAAPRPAGGGRNGPPARPAPPRNAAPQRRGALDGLGPLGSAISGINTLASMAPGLGFLSPVLGAGTAFTAASLNKTPNVVPAEAALDSAARNPVVSVPRMVANSVARSPVGATPLPGNGSVATVVDSAENFLKAVTGFRGNVSPQSYAPDTRDRMANAIDKAIVANRPTDDRNGFVPVDYDDYSPNGSRTDSVDRFVFGRFMGRRNPDGTYELRENERYDYTGGTYEGTPQYIKTTNQTVKDALERKDYLAVFSNSQDLISRNLGTGAEGFGIGGQFTRSNRELPRPAKSEPAPTRPTQPGPSGGSGFSFPMPGGGIGRTATPPPPKANPGGSWYGPAQPAGGSSITVNRGDTLWDISQRTGISIEELAKRNNISNPNLIDVGQVLRY